MNGRISAVEVEQAAANSVERDVAELAKLVMKRGPIIVAQSKGQRQVRPCLPIVLSENGITVHAHIFGESRELARLGIKIGRVLVVRSVVDKAPEIGMHLWAVGPS